MNGYANQNADKRSDVAEADLEFARRTIADAYPGAIDTNDSVYKGWYTKGFLQARELAKQALNAQQAAAAVSYYATGFMDGHLMVWFRQSARPAYWSGWMFQKVGNDFLVTENAKSWPVLLPPLGAKVLSCDGLSPPVYIEQKISPYIDRRLTLLSTWQRLAARATLDSPEETPLWEEARIKECVVELPSKVRQAFHQEWREHNEQKILTDRIYFRHPPVQQLVSLQKNIYWVHASNFQPNKAQNDSLELMLAELRKLDHAKLVVLDTRGNGGGNSGVGYRILKALLKSRLPESITDAEAFYRVSPLAIDTYESAATKFATHYGETSFEYKSVKQQLIGMRAAFDEGMQWSKQMPIPEEKIIEEGLPFQGQLVLLTDAWCASACLDFVDMVLKIPGVIHMGQPTSADTTYMEAAPVQMPSGLMMSVPIKVWRNRSRESNQPYVPQYIYSGHIQDTDAITQWVLNTVAEKIK